MALLWSLLFIDPLIILSTIFFGSISLVVSLFDTTGRTQIEVARVWSRSLAAGERVSRLVGTEDDWEPPRPAGERERPA